MPRRTRVTLEDLRNQISTAETPIPKGSVREMYPCPNCEEALYESEYDAAHCDCQKQQIWSVYVCGICYEKDRDGVHQFDTEHEVEEHIKTMHGIAVASFDLEEAYADMLRSGPVLGQWAFQMEATTEFLIPNV